MLRTRGRVRRRKNQAENHGAAVHSIGTSMKVLSGRAFFFSRQGQRDNQNCNGGFEGQSHRRPELDSEERKSIVLRVLRAEKCE